jgi:hypothetical protein
MTQNAPDTQNVAVAGGAAILAPIQSFPNGVPANAMVLIPLANGQPVEKQVVDGPVALTMEQVWKLLGFNGPAVQVQDAEGRPIAIGLEDLLKGLDEQWAQDKDNLDMGRVYAQELMKYERHERAEQVLAKIIAGGSADGNDWLALGVSQLAQKKLDKAERTLAGAQNLMKDNPYPSLHLAKLAKEKADAGAEKTAVEKAIGIQPGNVDAWAYLFNFHRQADGEEKAIAQIEELASSAANAKTAAPYVALQGFYAEDEAQRDKAIGFAKKGVQRAPGDPIPLIVLSALYGQTGKIEEVVKLLAPHEAMMQQDVRIAHNYFEALFQSRDLPKITALLNKLATSPNKEVKQFAIERSKAISQMLQQQQQALAATSQQKS